ncbi:serine/threonine-protein kinase, partial [Actinomadura bangladeshensis]
MSQSERLVLATRYRLVSEIGQGANGTVWRGHDELLDRAVAIKELRLPEDLSEDDRVVFYRRTLREARAPAQLRTHSIVEVYDVVIEQGRPWIVMEMIEAPSLEQLIERSGPLPPERVAHIGRALLDALNVAHKAGIVHRDLKPSNVLLDGDRVVLTDFGLAFSSGSASLTKTGHFMGSPAYVAPEVAAGEKATPRSDLWSLGATLYAALEGRPPFERENVMATLSALANESTPSPQNAGALAPVITGLLEKNPTRRLSHARAVDRLERALAGPRSGRRPPTPRYRLMAVIALIGATVASCGIGATALIVGMMKESPGPSPT